MVITTHQWMVTDVNTHLTFGVSTPLINLWNSTTFTLAPGWSCLFLIWQCFLWLFNALSFSHMVSFKEVQCWLSPATQKHLRHFLLSTKRVRLGMTNLVPRGDKYVHFLLSGSWSKWEEDIQERVNYLKELLIIAIQILTAVRFGVLLADLFLRAIDIRSIRGHTFTHLPAVPFSAL